MKVEIFNPFEVLNKRLDSIDDRVSLILSQARTSTIPSPECKFLDQKQVAELLGISTVSVWQWEKKGLLQSYRIGNLKRFKLNEVLAAPKRIVRNNKGGRAV